MFLKHIMLYSVLGTRWLFPKTDPCINNEVMQQRYTTFFWGVILGDKLSWKHHIQSVKIKISKNIGILHKCRKKFSVSTMKSLYYSFIYTYLSYSVELWRPAPKQYTDSICKLQKIHCRLILNAPKRTSSSQLFKDCIY